MTSPITRMGQVSRTWVPEFNAQGSPTATLPVGLTGKWLDEAAAAHITQPQGGFDLFAREGTVLLNTNFGHKIDLADPRVTPEVLTTVLRIVSAYPEDTELARRAKNFALGRLKTLIGSRKETFD